MRGIAKLAISLCLTLSMVGVATSQAGATTPPSTTPQLSFLTGSLDGASLSTPSQADEDWVGSISRSSGLSDVVAAFYPGYAIIGGLDSTGGGAGRVLVAQRGALDSAPVSALSFANTPSGFYEGTVNTYNLNNIGISSNGYGIIGQIGDIASIVGLGLLVICDASVVCGVAAVGATVVGGTAAILYEVSLIPLGTPLGSSYLTLSGLTSPTTAAIITEFNNAIYEARQIESYGIYGCDLYYYYSPTGGLSIGTNPATCPIPIHA